MTRLRRPGRCAILIGAGAHRRRTRRERDTIATISDRLAAGPISWGVCEVPGWGVQLPPERVFREMRSLGINVELDSIADPDAEEPTAIAAE